jgi:hypothetical protein
MKWTPEELTTLSRLYPDTPTVEIAKRLNRTEPQVYNKANGLGLRKSAAYLASAHACRLRGDVGAANRFKPGHAPHNKGKKGWAAGGRAAQTQFQKGQINGRAAELYKPIGSERINEDGYRERKVSDTGRTHERWKGVHVLLWETHYGPIPSGYAVCFIDGNKQNITRENLVLLSRSDLMRRNSYHNRYPKEIGRLIQLRGALMRQINKRARHEKQD